MPVPFAVTKRRWIKKILIPIPWRSYGGNAKSRFTGRPKLLFSQGFNKAFYFCSFNIKNVLKVKKINIKKTIILKYDNYSM